jgi:hypothetical protein
MTIIKNYFEVFLVTSKKHGNGIIESKVGLYSIKTSYIYLSVKCQLWPRFHVRNSTYLGLNLFLTTLIDMFRHFEQLPYLDFDTLFAL